MLIRHIIGELERERAMRVYVFPRLKKDGKITEAEASCRLERLSGAMEICQVLEDHGFLSTTAVQEHFRQLCTPLNNRESTSLPLNIKGGAQ